MQAGYWPTPSFHKIYSSKYFLSSQRNIFEVSQLDKNLEQLTVMYHKLVYQNNQLRGENQVMEKRITKKVATGWTAR